MLQQILLEAITFFVFTADQVYGDQDMHEVVRKHCMDYLVSHLSTSVIRNGVSELW